MGQFRDQERFDRRLTEDEQDVDKAGFDKGQQVSHVDCVKVSYLILPYRCNFCTMGPR